MVAGGGEIVAPDPAGIDRAVALLRAGRLVAFPTETVYGLGADAGSAAGVAEIYRVKGRPADHPLIVHVLDAEAAGAWAELDPRALRLVAALWPGPLSLVLRRRPDAPAYACGGQRTIGLRCPSHPVARNLLRAFAAAGGRGIAAPSANRFGRISPTRAQHVRDDLDGDVPLILDGGDAPIGLESTIVDLSGAEPRLLRPGGVAAGVVASLLGAELGVADAGAPKVSGMLAAHYAPGTALELVAPDRIEERVSALRIAGSRVAVWSRRRPAGFDGDWIQAPADPLDYGHVLYDTLRRLDRIGAQRLLIEAVPEGEAWDAVRDRLARAAAGAGRGD